MLVTDPYRDPSLVALTQEAQKQLIKPLLSNRFPIQWDWRRRYLLGSYHISEEAKKIHIITEVMKALWQDTPGVALLDSFKRFERFLRALGKRDHFIHQFEVFLLGWFIMDFLGTKGHSIKTLTSLEPQPFLKLWMLTAMGHDLGFPLQESPKIFGALRELYGHQSVGLHRTSHFFARLERKFVGVNFWGRSRLLRDLLSGIGVQIAEEIIMGIAQTTGLTQEMARLVWNKMKGASKNHGFLSALLLGRAVFRFFIPGGNLKKAATIDSQELQHFRLLLGAIGLHHLKEELPFVIKRIEFTRNPLAYLLYLTDNLQEWSRDMGGWTEEPTTLLSECEEKDTGIILTFVITHDSWDNAMVEKTLNEIEKAKIRLEWLKGPKTGLTLTALYTSAKQDIHGKDIPLMI
jgi:hypothetical protein